jgi:transposase
MLTRGASVDEVARLTGKDLSVVQKLVQEAEKPGSA